MDLEKQKLTQIKRDIDERYTAGDKDSDKLALLVLEATRLGRLIIERRAN